MIAWWWLLVAVAGGALILFIVLGLVWAKEAGRNK